MIPDEPREPEPDDKPAPARNWLLREIVEESEGGIVEVEPGRFLESKLPRPPG